MSLQSGTRLGPYEIVAPIGAGGMGEVYRARDPRLARDVAVKILPASFAADPDRLQRFEHEARAVAALSHPNVLAIFDVGTGPVPFLVTELLDGETLRGILERGPLPAARVVEIGLQLVAGLAAAHARRIVHRDLKPENIVLTRDGVVKILDFGLAKSDVPSEDGQSSVVPTIAPTAVGAVLGTVGYMAPEQLRGLKTDVRADIFAAGAILYELVAGRRAFAGDTAADTMSAILTARPPEVPAHEQAPGLMRIVDRCLEKDADNRFQSARDLRFALEALSDLRPVASTLPREGRSIAVLPFVSPSADADTEYFTDGLAEELIGALGRVPGLRVAARTSAFQFRGRAVDVREIGRQLNVDHILEGSVRRSGRRLRVTAQLVATANGYQLWSERFDREMADVFDIQDEIASSIVKTIQPTLVGAAAGAARRHGRNAAAFDLYLRGRHLWHQRTPPSLAAAAHYFEEAIALDPDYALAHAGLADARSVPVFWGFVAPADARPRAERAARRALALDPELAESQLATGVVSLWVGDWAHAGDYFRRAAELDPASVQAAGYLALWLANRRRYREAEDQARRVASLDPMSPFAAVMPASVLHECGRHDEALELAERALQLHPDFVLGLWVTCLCACQLGQLDLASQAAERLVSVTGRAPMFVGLLGLVHAVSGRPQQAHEALSELTARRERGEYVTPRADLLVCVGLKDRDRIYEALLASADEGMTGAALEGWLAPYLPALAGESRFARLFDRLQLALTEPPSAA